MHRQSGLILILDLSTALMLSKPQATATLKTLSTLFTPVEWYRKALHCKEAAPFNCLQSLLDSDCGICALGSFSAKSNFVPTKMNGASAKTNFTTSIWNFMFCASFSSYLEHSLSFREPNARQCFQRIECGHNCSR